MAYFEEERYSDAIPLFEMALQECNDPTVQKLARASFTALCDAFGTKVAVG